MKFKVTTAPQGCNKSYIVIDVETYSAEIMLHEQERTSRREVLARCFRAIVNYLRRNSNIKN